MCVKLYLDNQFQGRVISAAACYSRGSDNTCYPEVVHGFSQSLQADADEIQPPIRLRPHSHYYHHHHNQWLYSPCKDLGRLTPEVS
jgi:hypothetical protein